MKKFMEIITKMAIEMMMLFFFVLMVTGTIKGAFDIREFDLAYLLSIPALALISFFCFIVTRFSRDEAICSMRRRFLFYSLSPLVLILIILGYEFPAQAKASLILSLISLSCFIATYFSEDEAIRRRGEGFLILGLYLMIFFILPLE